MRQSTLIVVSAAVAMMCFSTMVSMCVADSDEKGDDAHHIIVHKEKEKKEEPPNPIVCTHNGCLCGVTHVKHDGYTKNKYDAFMGIPYAQAPIGNLRFAVSTIFFP